MYFIDTNVFIRYLTQDNKEQSAQAYELLKRVEAGLFIVTTSEAVITEIIHVLESKALYDLPREDIRTHLNNILSFKGLKLSYKNLYKRALDIYVQYSIDFVDALSVAYMEKKNINTVISFDKDFNKIPQLKTTEPE